MLLIKGRPSRGSVFVPLPSYQISWVDQQRLTPSGQTSPGCHSVWCTVQLMGTITCTVATGRYHPAFLQKPVLAAWRLQPRAYSLTCNAWATTCAYPPKSSSIYKSQRPRITFTHLGGVWPHLAASFCTAHVHSVPRHEAAASAGVKLTARPLCRE